MKRILLIEDDAILRENTAELLGLLEYDVTTAHNGQVGLEIAQKMLPDVIICDIMMPELDGYGVLEALAKNDVTQQIPFIFLSARTERKDVRKGMNLGADDYITKPFEEEELTSAIESRLAKSAILKERQSALDTITEEGENEELRTLNDLKNFFDDNGDTISYANGEVVYEEGQHSNNIYLISSGLIKCHKLDEQGKDLTTALYKEDDLFGYTSFTQKTPYQETATAIQDSKLIALSKNELANILNSNHKVTLELIQLLTNDLSTVKDQLLHMAYSSVKKRTASTILKFAEKLNRKPEDAIRISRSDLASVAGVAIESLIRTLSGFKDLGLIEIEGRNIRILDLERLQQIN